MRTAHLRTVLDTGGIDLGSLAQPYRREGDRPPVWLRELQAGDDVDLGAAELLALADVTGLEVDVLTGDVEPEASFAVAMRARTQSAPEAVRPRALDLLHVLARVEAVHPGQATSLVALRRYLSPDGSDAFPTRQQGPIAARVLRRTLELGREPIGDLRGVIEGLGVPVELTDQLPDRHHGLTAWNRTRTGWDAVMLINAHDPWTVQRFTMAHELAHVLFQDRPAELTTEVAGDMSDAIASDPTEGRAEAFAAELLAPFAALTGFWKDAGLSSAEPDIALARVMWQFGMSRKAATIQLENAAGVAWTHQDTAAVENRSVSTMLGRAKLTVQWGEVAVASEGTWLPSPWLVEETAALFTASRLPVENYAVAAGLDPMDALARLRA